MKQNLEHKSNYFNESVELILNIEYNNFINLNEHNSKLSYDKYELIIMYFIYYISTKFFNIRINNEVELGNQIIKLLPNKSIVDLNERVIAKIEDCKSNPNSNNQVLKVKYLFNKFKKV